MARSNQTLRTTPQARPHTRPGERRSTSPSCVSCSRRHRFSQPLVAATASPRCAPAAGAASVRSTRRSSLVFRSYRLTRRPSAYSLTRPPPTRLLINRQLEDVRGALEGVQPTCRCVLTSRCDGARRSCASQATREAVADVFALPCASPAVCFARAPLSPAEEALRPLGPGEERRCAPGGAMGAVGAVQRAPVPLELQHAGARSPERATAIRTSCAVAAGLRVLQFGFGRLPSLLTCAAHRSRPAFHACADAGEVVRGDRLARYAPLPPLRVLAPRPRATPRCVAAGALMPRLHASLRALPAAAQCAAPSSSRASSG